MNIENHEFMPWPKMARLSRECIITEKLDGTNACVNIVPTSEVSRLGDSSWATVHGDAMVAGSVSIFAGSRTRWIQPGNDNYGFAAWVRDNAVELAKLGPGRHFGEWFGLGIQRHYNLKEKRFSLFNVRRWSPDAVARNAEEWGKVCNRVVDQDGDEKCDCVGVVPILFRGEFSTGAVDTALALLKIQGSQAAPGFMDPEGVVVWHTAAGILFKKTIKDDDSPKSLVDKG